LVLDKLNNIDIMFIEIDNVINKIDLEDKMVTANFDRSKLYQKEIENKVEKRRWIPVILRQEVNQKPLLNRRRLLSEGAQMDYISTVKLNVY